jgi:hypothetical protein
MLLYNTAKLKNKTMSNENPTKKSSEISRSETEDASPIEDSVEKAGREAALVEAASQDKADSSVEATALLSKMTGGSQEKKVQAPSAADIESAEKIFGKAMRGPETSGQFEGSKIFYFQDNDGRNVCYALRRNADGQLEGNKFSLMEKVDGQWKNFTSFGVHMLDQKDPNYSTGPTYQMHSPDLEKMEALLQSKGIEI